MTANDRIHQGRNVKRFREMLGLKQEALADKLGDDWTQKKVSLLEAKEEIEPATLALVSRALNIPAEAIENFREENAVNVIATTFNNNDSASVGNTGTINFNPIDKWVEALEENKKLYERLLQTEREKVELLERMVNK